MMLPSYATVRLDRHGTGDHSATHSETIQPPRSAAGSLAEIGRAGSGVALRWRRHYLRWRSVGVEEIGGANGNRTALRCLLHRLPQIRSDRAPAVGSDR